MTPLILDPAAVNELVSAGMPERQAETVVRQQAKLLEQNLATKTDIEAIKAEIEALRQGTKPDLRQETKGHRNLRQGTRASKPPGASKPCARKLWPASKPRRWPHQVDLWPQPRDGESDRRPHQAVVTTGRPAGLRTSVLLLPHIRAFARCLPSFVCHPRPRSGIQCLFFFLRQLSRMTSCGVSAPRAEGEVLRGFGPHGEVLLFRQKDPKTMGARAWPFGCLCLSPELFGLRNSLRSNSPRLLTRVSGLGRSLARRRPVRWRHLMAIPGPSNGGYLQSRTPGGNRACLQMQKANDTGSTIRSGTSVGIGLGESRNDERECVVEVRPLGETRGGRLLKRKRMRSAATNVENDRGEKKGRMR